MGKKIISLSAVLLLLVALLAIKISSIQSKNSFSIEGKWENIGPTAFGVESDSKLIADENHCNLLGSEKAYVIKKDINGYKLEATDSNSGKTTSFHVDIYDNDHIELQHGSSVLKLQRAENLSEQTCTTAIKEDN